MKNKRDEAVLTMALACSAIFLSACAGEVDSATNTDAVEQVEAPKEAESLPDDAAGKNEQEGAQGQDAGKKLGLTVKTTSVIKPMVAERPSACVMSGHDTLGHY